jgi:hypothetical protein
MLQAPKIALSGLAAGSDAPLRSPAMRLRRVLLAASGLALSCVVAPASVPAAYCPPVTVHGVRILELTDEHGCDQGARLASRTVRNRGYLQTGPFFCRWGQGGTRPIEREGKTFYGGFCANEETEAEATFLARPGLSMCDGNRLDGDDLRARYVGCRTARRLYRRSLKVAARQARKVTRFRYVGYRWTCRAYNPHKRGGNPAWYEWKCRAAHDVLVHFRWFGGE